MKTEYSSSPFLAINSYISTALQDPAAKAVTLLQGIEHHANKMLDIPNNNNCEVANHAACIIDLTELCIWMINISTTSCETGNSNTGMSISPSTAFNHRPQDKYISSTLGQRIYHSRKKTGKTQAVIAGATGVTVQAVSLWESNSTTPTCDKIIPLANALKCDPLWLLTGNTEVVQEC